MPYNNVPEPLWGKMDRCVDSVMADGMPKPTAIAICYSSIMKKKVLTVITEQPLGEKVQVIGNQVRVQAPQCNYEDCEATGSWEFLVGGKQLCYCDAHVKGAAEVLRRNKLQFEVKSIKGYWIKAEGSFITTDDGQVIFIGGPGSGAGGSSGASAEQLERERWENAKRFDNENDADDYGNDKWGDTLNEIEDDDDMRDAVGVYTGGAYSEINGNLRHGEDINGEIEEAWINWSGEDYPDNDEDWYEIEDYFEQVIDNLDMAIENGKAPEDLILYRAVPTGTFSGLRKGDVIIDDGYVSTSFSQNQASEFGGQLLEIRVPKDTSCLFLDGLSEYPKELEVLFGRESRFRIIEEKDSGFVVEVIP